jgi:hypothetical protein
VQGRKAAAADSLWQGTTRRSLKAVSCRSPAPRSRWFSVRS